MTSNDPSKGLAPAGADPRFGEATPDNCEREPIHIPGAIQPHGALIGFDPDTGRVLHASANLGDWLPLDGAGALGGPLDALLGPTNAQAVRTALPAPGGGPVRHQVIGLPEPPGGRRLQVVLHRHAGCALAELEDDRDGEAHWLQRLSETIEDMRQASDLGDLVARTAQRVKALLGFDRVMVYRFDAEWNGQVIADAHEPGMEPFLHLHYPAGDIPAQARALYARNLVRYIADVDYRPVALQSLPGPGPAGAEAPLDMSHCLLRSVSPMHLQYLRNMGVASSLSLSLMVDGRLWGLIAAHHRRPTELPQSLRHACSALAVTAGYMVGWALQQALAEARARAQQLRKAIVDAFNNVQVPLPLVVRHCGMPLLRIVGATGGALWHGDGVHPFGQWPAPARAEALLQHARALAAEAPDRVHAADHLPLQPPLQPAELRQMSGLLVLPLGPDGHSGLLWLRPEWRRQVAWGGDPEHATQLELDAQGRPMLTPRSSFARWEQLVQGRARPWTAADLEAAAMLATLRDVLAVRASLVQVSLGERRFRSLIDLQSDTYWRTDTGGQLQSLSKPMPVGREAGGGQSLLELLRPHAAPADLQRLQALLDRREPFRDIKVQGRRADGSSFDLRVNGEPVLDQDGGFAGWHGTLTDLSHETTMKVALQQRQAAEAANREKSRFLSQISHELRTPLNAVIGFSQLLLHERTLSVEQRVKLEHIHKAGQWLLAMVSDLLDLSRIETGDLTITLRPVDTEAVLHEALDLVKTQADAAGIALLIDATAGLPPLAADEVRLKQVLVNLLSNAVKYNRPHGQVLVRAHPDALDPHLMRLEVRDTGDGMTEEQLAHLFEAFNRLGREKQSIQGTGIGLVIAKRLVEAMGGRLTASSEPGVGSSFVVALPCAEADTADDPGTLPAPLDAPEAAPEPPPAPPRTRVLYIEDDLTNAELMRAVTDSVADIDLLHLDNAEAGWAAVQAQPPAVVLVDLNLPGRPGSWFVEQLRAEPSLDAVHCVAVTADAMPDTLCRLADLGFDACWSKPLDLAQVAAQLPVMLARRRASRQEVDFDFDAPQVHARLDALWPEALDRLPMGVVRMNPMGVVTAYNAYESRRAGLSPERVLGRRFFDEVARCADNALVAGRLRDEPELDEVLDYVFTFRMRSSPVRLRLLRASTSPHRYMLVAPRST